MVAKKIAIGPSGQPISKQVDPNPYWSSSLFNEVYLRNDVPHKYRSIWDADNAFERFHQDFHNLVVETREEDFDSWSESDTIQNWIVHVMEMLGWHDKCESRRQNPYITELSMTIQEHSRKRTYRADLVYVDNPKFKQYITKETDPEKRLYEARSEHTGAKMVVEAKYWDRLEHYRQEKDEQKDRADVLQDESTRHLDPNDQVLKYMEILNLDFGILTDGKTWRLFHRELSIADSRRYFEFDLGNLAQLVRKGIDEPNSRNKYLEEAKYFFHFFRKASLVQCDSAAPFVHEVLQYCRKYASEIEDDLKSRFIEAMGYACNAIARSIPQSNKSIDLEIVRSLAESHLFNILFIRSCESRKVLPINAPAYHKLSLTEVIETLDHMRFDPEKSVEVYTRFLKAAFGEGFSSKGTEIYDRLLRLYSVVHDGDMGFEVVGFKTSVFSESEWKLAKTHTIDNQSMLHILFCLNFTDSDYTGRKHQQIPYNFFTARQLGSIYESFLEFKLAVADCHMVFRSNQWQVAESGTNSKRRGRAGRGAEVQSGELYFSPNNEERKLLGSYYTPDEVTNFIVEAALCPLCDGKGADEILEIKVCDPAMGSGHFLNAATQYLARRFREAKSGSSGKTLETNEASAQTILHSCIFGIDINPRAVKLAKLSLWIATSGHGRRLENLEMQLRCSNSLDDPTNGLFGQSGEFDFDAYIGNPPYQVSSRNKSPYIESIMEEYKLDVRGETNIQPLSDDYIKFMRFAHDRIQRRGFGTSAMITNNAYLSGRVHRGMRRSMVRFYDEIQILDLNGSAKAEVKSGDEKDENVFDIQQGVSIYIAVKRPESAEAEGKARVSHSELVGSRKRKLNFLKDTRCNDVRWTAIEPKAPYFFLVPKDFSLSEEYSNGVSVRDIFIKSFTGVGTGRDSAFVHFEKASAERFTKSLMDSAVPDSTFAREHDLKDTDSWRFSKRRTELRESGQRQIVRPYAYRPFDDRYVVYAPVIRRDQRESMACFEQSNLALLTCQQQAIPGFSHVFCTQLIVDESLLSNKTKERGYVFPLFTMAGARKVANLQPQFIDRITKSLDVSFSQSSKGKDVICAEDIFGYVYSVLHVTSYRKRYSNLLQLDFPVIPVVRDISLFRSMSSIGARLADLHLGRSKGAEKSFELKGRGSNKIESVKYDESAKQIWINASQSFEKVPLAVWSYRVGAYDVCQKWLKDRKGLALHPRHVSQYCEMLARVYEATVTVQQLDRCIEKAGGVEALFCGKSKRANPGAA
jgi:hypothetical protein